MKSLNESRTDLNPCPFCGSETYSYIEDDNNRWLTFHIRCNGCPANMSVIAAAGTRVPYNDEDEERLVNQWNTRLEVK